MKLRTKISLFFGSFFVVLITVATFFIGNIVGVAFNKQIASDFIIIAEQSEGTYFAFLDGLKSRAVDWSSDSTIVRISKAIISADVGTPERTSLENEFAEYVSRAKMPFDGTIFLVDLLDKNGVVVASTRFDRIGTNELKEEQEFRAHFFSEAITSSFGSAFVKSFVFEEDETDEPMTHVTTRIFDLGAGETAKPLDVVLLIHFANTKSLAHTLGVDVGDGVIEQSDEARITKMALLESYETSDIYLVDHNSILVTPSRHIKNVTLRQKIDTLPVRACIDKGEEVSDEYINFQGDTVIGASMCFPDDGLVLIVEVQKDEVLAPLYALVRLTVNGGIVMFVLGVIAIVFFVRFPLRRIDGVVGILERVTKGDFSVEAVVDSKDEIGVLSGMLNQMIVAIRNNQDILRETNTRLSESESVLKSDIERRKAQEEFLEQSKLATLNILEDSWELKEKAVDESNRLQSLLTSIGDGIVLIGTDYHIKLVNPMALKMFEASLDMVLGKDLRSIIKICVNNECIENSMWPTEEVFLTNSSVTTTIENNYSITTETRKSNLPVVISVSPLQGEGKGAVVVFSDATEDHELNEAKSGFISVASHQLRTPLTSIRWYSEMLLSEDAGALNEVQKDFMSEIHGGAERLYQTVDLLLGISRVESGKLKSERVSIDMNTFTADIKRELASQSDEKNLVVDVQPPGDSQISVWLDPIMLRQVILNLLSNAIRYTNENGRIEIAWKINEQAGDEVIYSVHDNGIGIPMNVRSRIFTKFFRAENARSAVPDGSGLGLALVKELVESWSGKVWFETTDGQGTTFYFTIPITSEVGS